MNTEVISTLRQFLPRLASIAGKPLDRVTSSDMEYLKAAILELANQLHTEK